MVVLKQCVDCGKYKELSEFVKDKNKPDGTRNRCKTCENLKRRKTPLPKNAKSGYKFCAKCGQEKSICEYNVRMIYKKNAIILLLQRLRKDYEQFQIQACMC